MFLVLLSSAALLTAAGTQTSDGRSLQSRLEHYSRTGDLRADVPLTQPEWEQLIGHMTAMSSKGAADSAPEEARWLGVMGAFVLELATDARDATWPQAREAVEWVCQQFQRLPKGSAIERRWHLAALALIEGAGDEWYLLWKPAPNTYVSRKIPYDHLAHIEERLGATPWTALARAIGHERETYPERRQFDFDTTDSKMKSAYEEVRFARENGLVLGNLPVERVRQADEYERRLKMEAVATELSRLSGDPAVGPDARLRLGVLMTRLGRFSAARESLSSAVGGGDNYVRYIGQFYLAECAQRLGDLAGTEAILREALATVPRAQSGVLRLAGLLALTGRQVAATAMVQQGLSEPIANDPVKEYGTGTYHLFPLRLKELRNELGLER